MNYSYQKLLMLGWLFLSCWAVAPAQNSPSANDAAERIKLVLVDNASTFRMNAEKNEYVNTLSITQPDGDYNLTASLLRGGDNHITFHRVDNELNDSTFARINLKAVPIEIAAATIGTATLYTDNPPSYNQAISLSAPWTATNCYMQTNGTAYISSTGSITYTVPAGYENATIAVYIYAGSNYRGGYYAVNNTVISVTSTGWKRHVIKGVNSGDIITIRGAQQTSSGYGLYDSPDILQIDMDLVPPVLPSMSVTPLISHKSGDNWTSETALANATVYHPNDQIDLSGCVVEDRFDVSTSTNSHSTHYNYHAELDANVLWPESAGTSDFYASVDYSKGDGSDLATCQYIGENNWKHNGYLAYYTPSSLPCMYIPYYAELMYTMPASFMGNTVNVTVTADTGQYGSGNLVVNGVNHAFAVGETYTWTVNVAAGGTILFTALDGDSYTGDISKIVISSGNGSALNAPAAQPKAQVLKMNNRDKVISLDKRDFITRELTIID